MGPIDQEGRSDTKGIIVAASPSSGASSLNEAGNELALASTTTTTITDVMTFGCTPVPTTGPHLSLFP